MVEVFDISPLVDDLPGADGPPVNGLDILIAFVLFLVGISDRCGIFRGCVSAAVEVKARDGGRLKVVLVGFYGQISLR
jgi:hypothetical protein